MKLILIHGSLQELVSKKVSEIKNNFEALEINESDGSDISLNSQSLFSEKRLVILNDPNLKAVENVLENEHPELTVILRFSKTLEKSSPILKKITGAKVETFSYIDPHQENIFPLLDMIGNKNKSAFAELEQNYEEFSGQYVLAMLGYFLRRMIIGSKSDFMNQKILSQKKNFPLEKIKKLYKEIIITDFKVKQGMLEEKLGVTLLIGKILDSN